MASNYLVGRYNYRYQLEEIEEQLLSEIRTAILEGQYILTTDVDRFERNFAEYIGSRYAVGVNSGTDALMIAFTAMSIGVGDEVITVANTFHATVLAILRTGARPVLVDCDSDSYLMNVDQVKTAITPRTKAITVVHLFGKPLDMAPILEIASLHSLPIVEDCAQAVGARWGMQRVGSLGVLGCFSFHPSKNLAAAGDAGAITTSDPTLNTHLRKLRHFGQEGQNDHQMIGFNSRLDTLQALVLQHKLPSLDKWNLLRAEKAQQYKARLADLPLTFQSSREQDNHIYHLFQVRTHYRDSLLNHLHNRGIDAVIRYPIPIHLQPAFSTLGYKLGSFSNAETLAKETLCLPIRPDLTDDEIDYVCRNIEEFFNGKRSSRSDNIFPPYPLT